MLISLSDLTTLRKCSYLQDNMCLAGFWGVLRDIDVKCFVKYYRMLIFVSLIYARYLSTVPLFNRK